MLLSSRSSFSTTGLWDWTSSFSILSSFSIRTRVSKGRISPLRKNEKTYLWELKQQMFEEGELERPEILVQRFAHLLRWVVLEAVAFPRPGVGEPRHLMRVLQARCCWFHFSLNKDFKGVGIKNSDFREWLSSNFTIVISSIFRLKESSKLLINYKSQK